MCSVTSSEFYTRTTRITSLSDECMNFSIAMIQHSLIEESYHQDYVDALPDFKCSMFAHVQVCECVNASCSNTFAESFLFDMQSAHIICQSRRCLTQSTTIYRRRPLCDMKKAIHTNTHTHTQSVHGLHSNTDESNFPRLHMPRTFSRRPMILFKHVHLIFRH